MTKTLTLKLPLELAKKIEAAAKRKRVTKSAYAREALDLAVRKDKAEPSLYELMKDHIGCFEGPPDLATNPKYMKGFGQWRR